MPGQVVVPLGQRDRELAGGAPVQLRRTARAGAAASGRAPELGLDQPLVGQLVQVELRRVSGHVGTRGGLVPAHRLGLRYDVEIQRPPGRLGQRADAAYLGAEAVDQTNSF